MADKFVMLWGLVITLCLCALYVGVAQTFNFPDWMNIPAGVICGFAGSRLSNV